VFLSPLLVRLTAANGAPGAGEVIEWLGIPAWILGIGTVLVLWLRGVIMLTSDHRGTVEAQKAACAAEVAAIRSETDARIREIERRADALQDRNEHLVSDRDAWRDAHHEETRARQAAERAAAALMETGQISLALLGALKDALAGRPEAGI
jgi:hypothetical protein